MKTTNTQPPHEMKFGRVRVKVWTRVGRNDAKRFNVELFRTYKVRDNSKLKGKDDAGFRDTFNFGEQDLEQLPQAIQAAKDYISQQKAK